MLSILTYHFTPCQNVVSQIAEVSSNCAKDAVMSGTSQVPKRATALGVPRRTFVPVTVAEPA